MEHPFTIDNLCACMGPQGGDELCPCRMRDQKRDGYYNCFGDQEALAKRNEEDRERLFKFLQRMADPGHNVLGKIKEAVDKQEVQDGG